jgi:hypothetical protein
MTNPLPPQPGFDIGTDVAGMERTLDDEMPGWRERFGSDLPDGIDLRPAVIRTRAFIVSNIEHFQRGTFTVRDLTPAQAAIMAFEIIRAQLSGPTMLGDPAVDAAG